MSSSLIVFSPHLLKVSSQSKDLDRGNIANFRLLNSTDSLSWVFQRRGNQAGLCSDSNIFRWVLYFKQHMQPTKVSTATEREKPAPLLSCFHTLSLCQHKVFCEYYAVLRRLKNKSSHWFWQGYFLAPRSCHLTTQIFVPAQRWGRFEATETTAFLAAVIWTDFLKPDNPPAVLFQECCFSKWGSQALFQDLCHTMTCNTVPLVFPKENCQE